MCDTAFLCGYVTMSCMHVYGTLQWFRVNARHFATNRICVNVSDKWKCWPIQRIKRSKFWSASTLIWYAFEQLRLWWLCVCAQAHLRLYWSAMWYQTEINSLNAVRNAFENVVGWSHCLTLLTNFHTETNSVDSYQTAPIEAVWYGSKLFLKEAFGTFQQMAKSDDWCKGWSY